MILKKVYISRGEGGGQGQFGKSLYFEFFFMTASLTDWRTEVNHRDASASNNPTLENNFPLVSLSVRPFLVTLYVS